MYYHGESINVNVVVTNNSNKTLRKIRISGKKNFYLSFIRINTHTRTHTHPLTTHSKISYVVVQNAEICLYSSTQYKCDVAALESR